MDNNGSALTLAKPCIDIGYFTNKPAPMLAFWREEMGLAAEEPVAFNDGLTQYRHACGDSVIKINAASNGAATGTTAYAELLLADAGLTAPQTLTDPDGNTIHRVPPGYRGISGLGLLVRTPEPAALATFYTRVMGFTRHDDGGIACGNTLLFAAPGPAATNNHWVNTGLSYFTVHVMRVDAAYKAMVVAGASPGEAPYSIGRIARISFVRDPQGNWIEVAQRAALAGPWWDDDE